MSDPLQSAVPVGALGAFLASPRTEPTVRSVELPKPQTRHSLAASAFLLLYIAVYLAIGFIGISLVGRIWASVFG